ITSTGLPRVNSPPCQFARRSVRERKGARAGRLPPATAKARRCREVVRATARIARACSCDIIATELALCRYTGCSLQSRAILRCSRLVVCEVGFLACDTCSGDKAIGACRTPWHCLAISFCSRRLGPDEHTQEQE